MRLSLYGESGLKQFEIYGSVYRRGSLPLRGEWIETATWSYSSLDSAASLPLRGEWIETSHGLALSRAKLCLSLYGESGLKGDNCHVIEVTGGLSLYGESGLKRSNSHKTLRPAESLPLRGEWIETVLSGYLGKTHPSLPLRGEWIETASPRVCGIQLLVSPFTGRVD